MTVEEAAVDWRGRRMTSKRAEQELGIKASTINTWHQRKGSTGLHRVGVSPVRNWPMFWESDLLALRDGLPIWSDDGHRIRRDWGLE